MRNRVHNGLGAPTRGGKLGHIPGASRASFFACPVVMCSGPNDRKARITVTHSVRRVPVVHDDIHPARRVETRTEVCEHVKRVLASVLAVARPADSTKRQVVD
jgi:hypothetical protein